MSTLTGDRDEGQAPPPMPLRNEELISLPRCTRCKLTYLPAKSTSALRLTYCSFLCELGDLGFSITGLEHMEVRRKAPEAAPAEPEPVAP